MQAHGGFCQRLARANAVSAALLGVIQSRIGHTQHFLETAEGSVTANSHADGNAQIGMNNGPIVRFHYGAQFLAQMPRLRGIGLGKSDDKFFAAVARHDIAFARVFLNQARDVPEYFIAYGVRKLVIDALEKNRCR